MVRFGDLPVEIHLLIAHSCAMAGPGTLSKFSRLTTQTYLMAHPLLTSSVDLARVESSACPDESRLRLFIYHFAPVHRSTLTWLAIPLSRSQMMSYHSIEDPLDELFADIISLLPYLSTLKLSIPTGSAEDSLDQGDFSLTLAATQRLNHLKSLGISGTHPCESPAPVAAPSSQFLGHVLSEVLPKLKSLEHLSFSQLSLFLPDWPTTPSPRVRLAHLHLRHCQHIPSVNKWSSSPFSDFVNAFSRDLQSLTIHTSSIDNSARQITADQLVHLNLVVFPEGTAANTTDQVKAENQLARRLLECFLECPLTSIALPQEGAFEAFQTLTRLGDFNSVIEVMR